MIVHERDGQDALSSRYGHRPRWPDPLDRVWQELAWAFAWRHPSFKRESHVLLSCRYLRPRKSGSHLAPLAVPEAIGCEPASPTTKSKAAAPGHDGSLSSGILLAASKTNGLSGARILTTRMNRFFFFIPGLSQVGVDKCGPPIKKAGQHSGAAQDGNAGWTPRRSWWMG